MLINKQIHRKIIQTHKNRITKTLHFINQKYTKADTLTSWFHYLMGKLLFLLSEGGCLKLLISDHLF